LERNPSRIHNEKTLPPVPSQSNMTTHIKNKPKIVYSKDYNSLDYVKPVDQIAFYSKLLNMFHIFKNKFEDNYREFFYKSKLQNFFKRSNNSQGRRLKDLK
jgi:hypothetical protein